MDVEAVEIGTNKTTAATAAAGSINSLSKAEHASSPLNMPMSAAGRSSAVPVLIESGSYSRFLTNGYKQSNHILCSIICR